MKCFTNKVIFIFALFLFSVDIHAQTVDKAKVAFEIFEYLISVIDESLPRDMGNMMIERVSISETSCDYYYTIKDDAEFLEYRANQSQVKKNLYISFDQNMSSMESSLLFCVDANLSLKYHYRNKIGNELVVTFSVAEMMDLLGKENITNTYRQDVVKRWLPIAFSAAAGTPMTYQGITDRSIMFTLMLEDYSWDDDIRLDQSFMVNIIRSAFENKEPGRIFPLLCLYSDKGEDLTMVNSKTGARKNGIISYYWLSNVYQTTHRANSSYSKDSLPPLPPDSFNTEESIPFQMVEIKPQFNGGDANVFSEWVNTQLIYPKEARDNGIMGRVTLQFTVDIDGSVTNVRVLRGVDPLLDAEAIRVVEKSPKWTPGMHEGRKVRVTYTFPVIFALR